MLSKSKEEYKKLLETHYVPIQMRPVWMNAVVKKGQWDVIIKSDKSGKAQGVLVYHYREFLGFRFILMPPLCFYNGIYLFNDKTLPNHKQIAFRNRVANELISALPSHVLYYQQYHPDFKNWFSLFKKKYKQTTRYTYHIRTDVNTDELWKGLKPNARRNIIKGEKRYSVKDVCFNTFWQALEKAYSNRFNPFQKNILSELYDKLNAISSCNLQLVFDEQENILAGSLIAYDVKSSYYVCGFYEPQYKEKAGLSYLLWHQIKYNPAPLFDFEGSMIPDIEYYFRAFGGQLVPHFRIWKINNTLLSPLIKFKFRDIF